MAFESKFPSISSISSFFFSPIDVRKLVPGPGALCRGRMGSVISWSWPETGAEEYVHSQDRCAVRRQTFFLVIQFVLFSYNFFPSYFLLFFYSLINTGNELHMATAFSSLCEICGSCIVYQFNMFATDAISVWQLSCLKSLFPTRYVPPQPSCPLSNTHHWELIPFPGWCHTPAKSSSLNILWPFKQMESSDALLCFHCYPRHTDHPRFKRPKLGPIAFSIRLTPIYLFPFNHEWILCIFGEILCPSDLSKQDATRKVHTLSELLDQALK